MVQVLTFGHGTATQDEIIRLLGGAGVAGVVDVRSAPGSRRHPHVARGELESWLPQQGISYRWDRRLGGFRKLPPDSPDPVWNNDAFRAYAAHMRTSEFQSAVDGLVDQAVGQVTAIMCGETVWWRCHRRMIADFLQLARGVEVRHLMHDSSLAENRPISGVRLRDDGLLVYDGGKPTPQHG
ncbi:DUF488 domain-containing protein [Saccharopolyspora sp. SCSIO 74807]|uniref:DUF488 domain-containing protein n=1 Tax=Saccharopolyspora sp. SCSIO 74807 TaxID=3118084 RepID=UPI0030D4DE8D